MAATSDVNESSEEKHSVEEVDLDTETEVGSHPNNIIKLEDLKVTELKSELEKRDLDKNGVKSVLIERLKAAIIEEGGDPDKYVNEVSTDSCANKSLPLDETIETMETNGEVESKDKLSILEEKVDAPLQLLIDEEEAQLNDDDGLMDIPKELDIESKLDESVQEDCKVLKGDKKIEAPKTPTKPTTPMKSPKGSSKDIKEKKIIKTTILSKSAEAVNTLSPKVLKVIGKNDKLKNPTVLAKSLWITGLPDTTRAADLKALFGKQGRVLSVKIVKSAKQTPGKCYGFVTMATSKDATKAIQNLHHTELNGRKISVERTQNEPGTLLKKSESKTLTFTAKKQTIRKEAAVAKQSLPVQKDLKPVSKEASKVEDKATESTKSSTEESRKKDDKVSSAEKTKLKEKERRSRERRDRERELHKPDRRPVFKSRPFGFDRSRYGGFNKHPFTSRPFSNRIGFGSSFKPRPNLLALQKLREERYLRDRMRERREAERRRADERHRYIERKQREEAYRLEREKERLRMEREILERERAEILRLEREKQRLERERLEREREELRRQAELRRSAKRPFSRIEREPEPVWDERKKPLTKYDSRVSYHPQSSSSSRYEYIPRERQSFGRDFERHPEKFGASKHLDVLHRADFDREARREVTIRTRDERQVFSRSEFRERDNRRSFASRERERHSSSRRENPREDWKHERRVHERIISGPSSSTQRRMAYF